MKPAKTRLYRLWIGLFAATLAIGCTRSSQPSPLAAAPAAAPTASGAEVIRRGTPLRLTAKDESTVDNVVTRSQNYAGRTVRMRGQVHRVCKTKGCWMALSPVGKSEPTIRVTFANYGFFVPTDCDGREAVVEGALILDELSPEHARHLAQEGADTPTNATAPIPELRFEATGVEILTMR